MRCRGCGKESASAETDKSIWYGLCESCAASLYNDSVKEAEIIRYQSWDERQHKCRRCSSMGARERITANIWSIMCDACAKKVYGTPPPHWTK